jgi:uncharacterized linocin/CFP29 family protein
MNYLNRHQASFPDKIWEEIDKEIAAAARDLLTGRRFLDLDGPYGAGLVSVEVGSDNYCRQPAPDEAGAVISRAISVPMIRKTFNLSVRRVEAHLQMGAPLSLTAAADAAEAVARREEEFIYYGQTDFGLEGLMTARGRNKLNRGNWSTLDRALNDVLAAVTELDSKGFHGPYAFALEPALYNGLFRRYEGSDLLQIEHIRKLCALGIYKASITGAVVTDARVGRLLVGQDLMAGYSANDGIHYQLFVSESQVLLLEEPEAICTLEAAGRSVKA